MYREFEEYVSNFNIQDAGINRKLYHSKRVAIISSRIAQNLNWSLHDVMLAKQIGLLHDIGRMKEWEFHQTFKDTKFDHGTYGAKVLKKDNFIKKFSINESDFETVCNAVYYHNKYSVPKKLRGNKQIKLIRDADKIDIFNILSDNDKLETNYKGNNISSKVKKDFDNNKLINNKDVKTLGDKILQTLAFIYDINYDYSLYLIKENNYLNKYYETIENKEIYEGYFNKINNYIEKRLNDVRN